MSRAQSLYIRDIRDLRSKSLYKLYTSVSHAQARPPFGAAGTSTGDSRTSGTLPVHSPAAHLSGAVFP